MTLGFDDLPQEVRAILPDVTGAVIGTIIGSNTTDPTTEIRKDNVGWAALVAVYDYAPAAPLELHREGAIRLAGWLLGVRPHARSQNLGDPSGAGLQLEFLNGQATANGLRASGASALLSRYVVRRAGAIG